MEDTAGHLQAMVRSRRTTQAIDEYLQKLDINATDQFGSTLLHVVAQSTGDRALTEYIISQGANLDAVDQEGYTPLALACTSVYKGPVAALLEAGASPNASPTRHPLLYAIVSKDVQIVKALLDAGASTQAQDKATGMTAAAAARLYGTSTIAKLLEDHEACQNIKKEKQSLLESVAEPTASSRKVKI